MPDVLPDWYTTLRAIRGFAVEYAKARAWLDRKGITEAHAESVAYALLGKWDPKRWKEPWPTFQNWALMPARDQPKGRPAYEPTPMDGKGWANAVPLPPEEES
jgi:hypothetical protein